jgi:two-component system response regulator NreC
MSTIKLLLADDHVMVRSALRMLLEAQEDMTIVGEAKNGREAVALTRSLRPDIVLMDVQMPEMNGIEATREIKKGGGETAVLALTMYEDEQYFFEMLKAGASGYIPKRAAPDELVAAIRTVYNGEVFLFPSLAAQLVKDYIEKEPVVAKEPAATKQTPAASVLTKRERQVLILIADGLTNIAVAEKLGISAKTVARHRENMMQKLDIHSRTELVKYAIREGVVDLNS